MRSIRASLAAAALAAAVAAAAAHAVVPGVPAIYVNYNPDCTFSLNADGGFTMTSSMGPGPTLPPGQYQVLVQMQNPSNGYPCTTPVFTLTGPGVSTVTTFPGAAINDEQMVTLQPSSTYVAADRNVPDATRRVFSTSATGSSLSLVGSTPGMGSGSGKGSTQAPLVGSDVAPYRGKLLAAVSATGRATLTAGGRSVGSLRAGTYDLVVTDGDRLAGFFVERGKGTVVAVTSLPFVGKRTRRITLGAGTWTFFSRVGNPTAFSVR